MALLLNSVFRLANYFCRANICNLVIHVIHSRHTMHSRWKCAFKQDERQKSQSKLIVLPCLGVESVSHPTCGKNLSFFPQHAQELSPVPQRRQISARRKRLLPCRGISVSQEQVSCPGGAHQDLPV